ncbi:ABC transporter ATP-binding protein [Bdellovibrio svalbardensis]|uniref:ABC transporter ATP-binding protein n=1 Tax=Bdellovibrio svalbardensis TaxID=2972972 RepID=A0ABT6DJR7_9BACT|nr:ABC transporter ATP-binding protein [Bdellovibrio svalbardensis]MDG0817092.1 ABC transporter ATP-binding protein [Bdellovibrio svalbardensis]
MNLQPAVEFRGISKYFGDVKANSDISFTVTAGSIHGIVGENGAGKSTAMKILFGLYRPDEGEILVNGQPVHFHSSVDAMSAKIGMVHQHFMLAEPFTALDNILLQQKGSAFSILPRAEQKARLHEIAQRYGFDINLDAKIEDLSVGAQQRIEILKILSQDSQILILDEPTAVLTPQEVQDLFKNLKRLKEEGKTILIITHKLKEVMSLTDEVTIFRAGQVVANKKTAETSAADLAELMVGRRLQNPQERKTSVNTDSTILNISNLNAALGTHKIHDINLQVHTSEIVGIAGVEGNGQDVLIRALLDPHSLNKKSFSGDLKVHGKMGSFPEDRLRFGVLPSRPVWENFLLGQQKISRFARGIFLKGQEVLRATQEAMESYDVRPRNAYLPFEKLSGGNQQKLVVARALSQKPRFVIAAQPTRGVDIGAIEFIHNELRKCRDDGTGVLLISSELDELMALSDRILVLYKGRLVAEFSRSQFDEIALGTAMGGCH